MINLNRLVQIYLEKHQKILKDTKKAVTFASKTNKHASKKAGDKILNMLSREKLPTTPKKMTQQEINNRVLQIMSGGKII